MSHKCQLLHYFSVIGPHKYNKAYIFPLRLWSSVGIVHFFYK